MWVDNLCLSLTLRCVWHTSAEQCPCFRASRQLAPLASDGGHVSLCILWWALDLPKEGCHLSKKKPSYENDATRQTWEILSIHPHQDVKLFFSIALLFRFCNLQGFFFPQFSLLSLLCYSVSFFAPEIESYLFILYNRVWNCSIHCRAFAMKVKPHTIL